MTICLFVLPCSILLCCAFPLVVSPCRPCCSPGGAAVALARPKKSPGAVATATTTATRAERGSSPGSGDSFAGESPLATSRTARGGTAGGGGATAVADDSEFLKMALKRSSFIFGSQTRTNESDSRYAGRSFPGRLILRLFVLFPNHHWIAFVRSLILLLPWKWS